MRFRKKPVVIEAHRWDGDISAVAEWVKPFPGSIYWKTEKGAILIPTLEGVMRCDEGDWIIRGVKGEFYPCQPNIFEARYELESAVWAEQGWQPAVHLCHRCERAAYVGLPCLNCGAADILPLPPASADPKEP